MPGVGRRDAGKYRRNLRRITLSAGAALLVAVALGLATELWLRGVGAPVDPTEREVPSVGTTLSLALAAARLAIPVAGALVMIPLLSSQVVYRLYAARDLEEAHDALNRIVFGQVGRRPTLVAREGKIVYGANSFSERVGGPATMVVYNDTAVVTEQHGRIGRVLGAGVGRLEPFERPWEVIDLRPQRWVYEVFALTKEGIPVSCEADVSFQIETASQPPGGEEEPYPFDEEAVFRAATAKWVREPGHPEQVRTWAGRVVIGFTDGILRNILAGYRLDWLIAAPQPGRQHPRDEIRRRLEEDLKGCIGSVGARLIDVRIGKIEVKSREEETARQLGDLVSTQWMEAWQADLEARALASRAEGEAELLRMDLARVQAQAEMVVTLTEALQSTIANQGQVEPYILALRFVEALRWMSYNSYAHEFMPPEAMRTLRQLHKMLAGETSTASEEEGDGGRRRRD